MVKMEGIIEIAGANAVWMDPVAVLNSSYSHYKVSHSRYYSRSSFDNRNCSGENPADEVVVKVSRKRKRKKAAYEPNEKELLAELRHQEARSAILYAHSSFLATTYPEISAVVPSNEATLGRIGTEDNDLDFRRLAEVWQAPLYELSVLKTSSEMFPEDGLHEGVDERVSGTYQLFNAFIENEDREAIAECAGAFFILPRRCRFLISDVSQVHQLITDRNQDAGPFNPGYNIIVIDPPWENKSVRRHSLYPMMPNKQLFSLPVKQLANKEGALVALWLTNREKLHQFVEKELFPSWGVKLSATWYWLKLNALGQMISPLDLQHHKPYECLLLGYIFGDEASSVENAPEADAKKESEAYLLPPEKFVLMSIPGDHSRKPHIGCILYVVSCFLMNNV